MTYRLFLIMKAFLTTTVNILFILFAILPTHKPLTMHY